MARLSWQWLGIKPIHAVLHLQEELFQKKLRGDDGEEDFLLFCEHPPCFTYTHISFEKFLRIPREHFEAMHVPVLRVSRGGGITFHGPGQLVAYFIVTLSNATLPYSPFGRMIENAVIDMLSSFGIRVTPVPSNSALTTNPSARGAWVDGKRKIMQKGLRFRRGNHGYAISQFGCAINVTTDLSYYDTIYPCGLDIQMTSLAKEIGRHVPLREVAMRLVDTLAYEFFPYDIQEKKTA